MYPSSTSTTRPLETQSSQTSHRRSAIGEYTPACLDEYQHAPEVLDALKARLNREGSRPGTAVLTGSTRQDALPRTSQALTGRLHTLTIWPLSQGEIAGDAENLLPALRVDPDAAVGAYPTSGTTRAEYVARVCGGGFPLALQRGRGRHATDGSMTTFSSPSSETLWSS